MMVEIFRRSWPLVGLWLMLRLLTSGWMALVSAIYPYTEREQTIALWPPTAPFDEWLARIFLSPMERWDVHLYLAIVEHGYRADDGTAQFHPLFPWLATPVAWITGSPLLALVLVSSIATLLLVLVAERLARLDQPPDEGHSGARLLLMSPLAFALFVPYTEGLFLLWAILCFFWARKGMWWYAGGAAALATLTRQQGIFLMIPLAWELWEASDRTLRRALTTWRNWLVLAMPPMALLFWLIYRALALNDLHADWSSLHSIIYSLLISPSSAKVVPEQAFLLPWDAFGRTLQAYWQRRDYRILIDIVLGISFLVLVIATWQNMRISARLYTLVIVIVSFSYYTGPTYPAMGLPRHLLLAFPVFLALGTVIRHSPARLAVSTMGIIGMLFLLLQFVMRSWVP